MKTVTREWLDAFTTERGSWRNSQLVQLGEPWPPRRGWADRAIGREISDEAARLFEHYATHRPKGEERRRLRGENKAKRPERVKAPKPNRQAVAAYAGDVTGAEFLASYQWRRLRMEVLRHYGPRCMCCGATPENGATMNVDHIKPRRSHPSLALEFDNLQVLCGECNHGKGNWDTTDWRPRDERIDPSVAAFIRSIAREP